MKHLKRSFMILILLTAITGSRIYAQDYLLGLNLNQLSKIPSLKLQVIQDNEYIATGYEQGNFYNDPLLLNGKPMDYNINLKSTGDLTVIKGSATTGDTTQVPFYAYLRRNGKKISIPGSERSYINHIKIDISEILRRANPGDQLVIEAVKKEDGPVKRIFKVVQGGGC